MSLKKKVRFQLPVISIGDDSNVPVKRCMSKTLSVSDEVVSKNDEILFFYPKFPRLVPTEHNVNRTKQRHIKHCWICSSLYSDIILDGNKLQDPKKLRHIQRGYKSTMELSNLLLQAHLPIFATKLNKKVIPGCRLNPHEDFYNWKRSHYGQKNFKQRSKDRWDSDGIRLLQTYCDILAKY